MAVKAVPEGYHTATPYLIVKGASEAIEFCGKAFGAKELMRFADPDGKVGHAEMQIGNSRIMIADEYPEMGFRGPKTLGTCPSNGLGRVADAAPSDARRRDERDRSAR